MATNSPDPNAPHPSSLQGMLARLRGMSQASAASDPEDDEEVLPVWDAPALAKSAPAAPNIPLAQPVGGMKAAEPVAQATPVPPPPVAEADVPAEPQTCPICQASRAGTDLYCGDCGYLFPKDMPATKARAAAPKPGTRIKGRYELKEQVNARGGITRFRGLDHGAGNPQGVPVVIVRAEAPVAVEPILAAEVAEPVDLGTDEIMPSFDFGGVTAQPVTDPDMAFLAWPSIAWERSLLENTRHPSLPAVIENFVEESFEYLVEDGAVGQSLWDAWDDPDATSEHRFTYLKQLAEGLHALHQGGAILEGLRPDIIIVTADGKAKLIDLSDLLPLPVPPDAPIRATLYSAPELKSYSGNVDARADLYSFGAMIYALHVGRELTEMDFDKGAPKPFIPRFPDIHPLFGRLVSKTFCRNPEGRFPSDEAAKEDASGFTELIRTLDVCRRTLDSVRLEIAAWTTTGMIRTGNEGAFALLHAIESRQDDLGEAAAILLCDGMGGYEAGEIAAALAIQQMRKFLLQQKPFGLVAGGTTFPPDGAKPADPTPLDVESMKKLLLEALKDANKYIYTASRSGIGRRGMGCTAEAVYVDGRNVVVGHVGDSRTYHLHEGRLIQLTRDQTLVNRLVELGTLSPEEAENHPRKNELQQALGGQPNVEPGVYAGVMKPGDWVIVCSDGVTNHVTNDMLKEMLQGEATSAEVAARRLVNLVNIEGATDNATVVVVRAT